MERVETRNWPNFWISEKVDVCPTNGWTIFGATIIAVYTTGVEFTSGVMGHRQTEASQPSGRKFMPFANIHNIRMHEGGAE